MFAEGTRNVDLYDFFSIFLPGATLLIGLAPFLPDGQVIPATAVIGAGIVLGLVLGRSVHALRLLIEKKANVPSHRYLFISQLINPTVLTDDLTDQFYACCLEAFDTTLPEDRADLDENIHWDQLEMLYALVRSTIHSNARGRSRTFQAIFDFYGSIYLVACLLSVAYMSFALIEILQIFGGETQAYVSYLGDLNIQPSFVFFGGAFLFGGAYVVFRNVRRKYRYYYLQYFMSDFVVLQKMQ